MGQLLDTPCFEWLDAYEAGPDLIQGGWVQGQVADRDGLSLARTSSGWMHRRHLIRGQMSWGGTCASDELGGTCASGDSLVSPLTFVPPRLIVCTLSRLQVKDTVFYFSLQPVTAAADPIELSMTSGGENGTMADISRGMSVELF